MSCRSAGNPKYDRVDAEVLLPQIEAAYAVKVEEARALVIQREREAEIAAENDRRDRADWIEANAELVESTFAKARALQSAYGDALHQKDLIARMLAHRPSPLLIEDMQRAIAAAEVKILRTANSAVLARVKTTAAWADETVILAVKILTGLDDDHAKKRNKIGWDAFHTAIGHWCHGALQDARYRDKALLLARSILGGYVKQLADHMPDADLGKAA